MFFGPPFIAMAALDLQHSGAERAPRFIRKVDNCHISPRFRACEISSKSGSCLGILSTTLAKTLQLRPETSPKKRNSNVPLFLLRQLPHTARWKSGIYHADRDRGPGDRRVLGGARRAVQGASLVYLYVGVLFRLCLSGLLVILNVLRNCRRRRRAST